MKLSLRCQDQQHQNHQSHHYQPHSLRNNKPILLRAKVPITVFGLPFLSGVTAADPSDLSFSLRTNLPSGPSLKLSYSPTTSTNTTSVTTPLALTLKSGVSLFGSPNNSPLIISAHFTFSPQNPNPSIPTFSLQFKPQFGDFSLRKTTHSPPNPNPTPNTKANSEISSMGFVPLEKPLAWKDLTLESSPNPNPNHKETLFSGIEVMAKTRLPVTKRVAINCRWGVNFPVDIGKKLPFLTVNKIGLERYDEVREVKAVDVKNSTGNVDDLELLKGLCLSVTRELELLQKENREMKERLEDIRFGKLQGLGWTYQGRGDGVSKRATPLVENSGGFEQWKSKKSVGEEHMHKELKKNGNQASDLESELQRAIKAASV